LYFVDGWRVPFSMSAIVSMCEWESFDEARVLERMTSRPVSNPEYASISRDGTMVWMDNPDRVAREKEGGGLAKPDLVKTRKLIKSMIWGPNNRAAQECGTEAHSLMELFAMDETIRMEGPSFSFNPFDDPGAIRKAAQEYAKRAEEYSRAAVSASIACAWLATMREKGYEVFETEATFWGGGPFESSGPVGNDVAPGLEEEARAVQKLHDDMMELHALVVEYQRSWRSAAHHLSRSREQMKTLLTHVEVAELNGNHKEADRLRMELKYVRRDAESLPGKIEELKNRGGSPEEWDAKRVKIKHMARELLARRRALRYKQTLEGPPLCAGSVDLILHHRDDPPNVVSIYDWKTTDIRKNPDKFFSSHSSLKFFEGSPGKTWGKWRVQASGYADLAERFYGLKVKTIAMVVIHPNLAFEGARVYEFSKLDMTPVLEFAARKAFPKGKETVLDTSGPSFEECLKMEQ
jgi:hypothetical protein